MIETVGMPYSEEAESAIISSMLVDMGATAEVSTCLIPDDFYIPSHSIIFEAILEVYNRGEKVDIVTVVERIKKNGLLDKVGGASFVTSLVRGNVSSANVKYYADIVREKSILRELIKKSNFIIDRATAGKEDVNVILDGAENLIFDIRKKRRSEKIQPITPLLKEVMKTIEKRAETKNPVTGVAAGLRALDKMCAGFQNSELLIVASRPSVGKTALALNLASYVSIQEKVPVLFFSLEMHWENLIFRLLSAESRIDGKRIRSGYIKEDEWVALTSAVSRLTESPFYIDASPGMTVFELRAKARRMKKKYNIGIIFVDYLQLIKGPESQTREQEVAAISRALKSIAMELNIPVVALSQLSRQPERRGKNAKPVLSDLRESGAIEQDADLVLFIHRPDRFKKDSESPEERAELIIAKQRNGPTGIINLAFSRKYARFDNYEGIEEE
ncbi:MAG: replicative DNA helicase [candidate division WOR-3 bacterium]|nr:replicative DNA helicase [candidate division WOR-3 bacterium]